MTQKGNTISSTIIETTNPPTTIETTKAPTIPPRPVTSQIRNDSA
jgi:hypothetical protein